MHIRVVIVNKTIARDLSSHFSIQGMVACLLEWHPSTFREVYYCRIPIEMQQVNYYLRRPLPIGSSKVFYEHPQLYHWWLEVCPHGVIVKVLDCGIVVSEFELQLHYYVHFQTNTLGKGMNLLILPAMGYKASLLFFKKDGFGIK